MYFNSVYAISHVMKLSVPTTEIQASMIHDTILIHQNKLCDLIELVDLSYKVKVFLTKKFPIMSIFGFILSQ